MASFDPTVLSDIQGPDVSGSMAKGFQLKDMVDQNQLSQLKINSLKSEQNENAKAKAILSDSDLSTSRGVTEAQEKLTKAGLWQKSMEVGKYAQQRQSGELDNQLKRLEVHEKSLDFGASLLDPIVAQSDAMRQQGKSDAMIRAYIHAQIPLVMQRIQEDQTLPPDIKKAALQKAAQEQNMTYDELKSVESQTKEGRAMIQSRIEDLRAQTGAKAEKEHERHDEVMEGLAASNPNRAAPPAGASDLLAAMTAKGVTLPQGLRSKAVLNQTLEGLIRKYPNLSPDEIADQVKSGTIEMGVAKTEGSVLGRREAAILPVEKSITKPGGFLDQAEKAVNSVDFSKLKAAGSFEKWGKDQLSDPNLSRYKAAVAELRAEYSIVLSKGGQVTDAARDESKKVIPDLITPAQFQTIKQVVKQGIEASKSGVEESIQDVTGKPGAAPAQNDPLGIR